MIVLGGDIAIGLGQLRIGGEQLADLGGLWMSVVDDDAAIAADASTRG